MPSFQENREVKAEALANALHAGAITAAQAQCFNEGQWGLASQLAKVKPPKTSIPLALQKLRELEDQDRALAVARSFFYESPEPVGDVIVCSNCGLGREHTIDPGGGPDLPCCDGLRYCPDCGEEHTDDRRDGQECAECLAVNEYELEEA